MNFMKKFLLVAAVAAGLGATSCSKKESVNGQTKSNTSHSTMRADQQVAWVSHDECDGAGRSCSVGGPIVLHPVAYSLMAAAASSGSSSTVGSTFNSPDLDEVIDGMDPDFVAKLQSGNYYMTLNYDGTNVINYMVGTSYPVTGQNMDFAFQVEK